MLESLVLDNYLESKGKLEEYKKQILKMEDVGFKCCSLCHLQIVTSGQNLQIELFYTLRR